MLSKQIPGFDILTFIMSIGIVGVHCHLCQAVCLVNNFLGGVISGYHSLCVPGFFIVSSYLFFRKCWNQGFKNSNMSFVRFMKRMSSIYLFYFILLSPIIIINRGWFFMGLEQGLYTFFLDILLRYTYPGSWFLSALMVSVTTVWICGRYIKTYWLLGPLWILFLYVYNIELFPKELQDGFVWYEQHVRTMKLSFPAALFPVCLGSVLAHPKVQKMIDKMIPYNFLVLLFTIALFTGYCVCDSIGLKVVLLTFVFVYFRNLQLRGGHIYIRLREYSILFFMWHFIVLEIIKVILHKKEQDFDMFGIWIFLIVLLAIFAISTIILFLENKKIFKWLKFSH